MIKKILIISLLLASQLAFGANSAINPANLGNLGGYQGTSFSLDNGTLFTFDNLGTTSSTSVSYRYVGDSLEVRGYTAMGTLVGSPLAINIPSSLGSIDCTKVADFKTDLGSVSYTHLTLPTNREV